MARADLLNILYSKDKSPLEFKFDSLWLPTLSNYIPMQDVQALNNVATSIKYNSKIEMKYAEINRIMTNLGFKKFHAGTNRVVYSYYEDQSFVVKVALDRVGLGDNPAEYRNQNILKPFITKVFDVSPCGTIGSFERVEPITSEAEFAYMAGDVYDLLVNFIIGKYVLEDIGAKYFMNWGIRKGFGPCLLDFPYVFELDGNKIHCNIPVIPNTKFPVCDGEIDYDDGFNNLKCSRCGEMYFAKNLEVQKDNKLIIIKGDSSMRVRIVRGEEIVCDPGKSSDFIKPPELKPEAFKYQSEPTSKLILVDSMGNRIIDNYTAKQAPPMPNICHDEKAFDSFTSPEKVEVKTVEGPKILVGDKSKFIEPALQTKEAEVQEVVAPAVQFVVFHMLSDAMQGYPFEQDEKADLNQRKNMVKYLLDFLEVEIAEKKIELTEDPSKIVNDYLDIKYKFEVEPPKPTNEDAEALLAKFNLTENDFAEPGFEKITKGNSRKNLENF